MLEDEVSALGGMNLHHCCLLCLLRLGVGGTYCRVLVIVFSALKRGLTSVAEGMAEQSKSGWREENARMILVSKVVE